MRIGVPREIYAGEKRVATTPDVAARRRCCELFRRVL